MSKPLAMRDCAILAALLLLSLWVANGFLRADRFPLGHDQEAHMIRLAAFDVAIREGQLPPLWAGDMYYGYGSPVFGFYPTFLYYAAEPWLLLGATPLTAWRITIVLSTILTAWLMFGWLRGRAGGLGAGVAAAAITLAPYHLLDLYVRAAYTEYAAFACAIAMLWSAQAWMESGNRRAWFAVVLSTAVTLGVHLGSIIMMGPLTAIWMLLLMPRPDGQGVKRLAIGWCALGTALAVTVADWLPTMVEKELYRIDQETLGGYFVYADHFLSLRELTKPEWGFGISRGGAPEESTSFQLGLVHWLGIGLMPILLIADVRRREIVALLVLWVLGIGMTLPLSMPLWKLTTIVQALQFPWRFLLPVVIVASAALAYVVITVEKYSRGAAVAGVVLLLLATGAAYGRYVLYGFNDKDLHRHSRELLSYLKPLGLGRPEYVPAAAAVIPGSVSPTQVSLPGDHYLLILQEQGNLLRYRVSIPEATVMRIERFMYPGWSALIDGEPRELLAHPETHALLLPLPAGEHEVEIKVGWTPVRKWAGAGTLVSLLGLAVLWLRWPSEQESWRDVEKSPQPE